MSLNQNFSKNVNAILTTRKQSIAQFAEDLYISRSSLQNILNGTCNLRMDTVSHIAGCLNTDPLVLLQDKYSSEQLGTALLILNSLEKYRKLSYDDRLEAARLFDDLLTILDMGTE